MPSDLRLIPLAYQPDSTAWFCAIRQLPRPVWLDSCFHGSPYGRFDLLAAAPLYTLETLGDLTRISASNGLIEESSADPFLLIKHYLPELDLTPQGLNPANPGLPFYGGALGYFGYDLGRRLETLPARAVQDIELPDMALGIYPWAIIQDHQQKTAYLVINQALVSASREPAYNFSQIEQICQLAPEQAWFHDLNQYFNKLEKFKLIKKFQSNLKVNEYHSALAKIQEYILAGDCYQVNFAQRFSTHFQGDALLAYLHLRQLLPSPFAGFMPLEQGAILSLSPERFVQVEGTRVETKPIKGTIKRGASAQEDRANAQWLAASAKNRAENVMIVDLLRNDLSKHCAEVEVPRLCELQSFANVHHLVSTVTARLRPGVSAIDVLRDAFPGGSITGAPKIRAMEIIEELEPSRRSVYCGSLGYISCHGHLDTSIAIRTMVCDREQIHCWGGGGIVADSDAQAEYQESLAKVQLLMDGLGQVKTSGASKSD